MGEINQSVNFTVLVIVLLIIFCYGNPDLLDSCIDVLQALAGYINHLTGK